jgi:hypothetical protein
MAENSRPVRGSVRQLPPEPRTILSGVASRAAQHWIDRSSQYEPAQRMSFTK